MTYTAFEEYWVQIALEDGSLLSTVFVTDWSEILELQIDRKLYPCLVVEIHQVTGDSESAAVELRIEGAYTVITGMPEGERREVYRAAMTANLDAMLRIHERITCDSDAEGIFDADLKIQFDPIHKATADNAYGWRGYFSIGGIVAGD